MARPTPTVRALSRCGMGLLALSLMACSVFRPKLPSYVSENMTQEEWSEWYSGHEDDGRVWARNVRTLTLNPIVQPMTHAHWVMDATIVNIRAVAGELDSVQKAGGTFVVSKTPGGKLDLVISRPEGVVASAARAALASLPFGNQDAKLNIVLQNVSLGANELGRIAPAVEGLNFAVVSARNDLRSGKPLGFDLPDGVTRDDYMAVIDASLVGLDGACREIAAYRASLAATLAVLESLDSSRQGSVDNLYLVLAAALDERATYQKFRQAPFPPPPEQRAEIRKTADDLEKAALANPRYQEWAKAPHWVNPRAIVDFVQAGVDTAIQFSTIYAQICGVDVVGEIRERLATGLDPGDMLDVGLTLAPSGSKLRGILQTGKNVYAKAVDAKSKVDAVRSQVEAAANDPTGAAAAGGSALIAWAAPAQVAQARQVIDSLAAPAPPPGH